jgi:hypothetical protein
VVGITAGRKGLMIICYHNTSSSAAASVVFFRGQVACKCLQLQAVRRAYCLARPGLMIISRFLRYAHTCGWRSVLFAIGT